MKKSPDSTETRPASAVFFSSRIAARSLTCGRSKVVPWSPGRCSSRASISMPLPPPTSTTLPLRDQSRVSSGITRSAAVPDMARSKLRPRIGCACSQSKKRAPKRASNAGSPVRRLAVAPAQASYISAPKNIASWRNEPSTPSRRSSPVSVSAQPPAVVLDEQAVGLEQAQHPAERVRVGRDLARELVGAGDARGDRVRDSQLGDRGDRLRPHHPGHEVEQARGRMRRSHAAIVACFGTMDEPFGMQVRFTAHPGKGHEFVAILRDAAIDLEDFEALPPLPGQPGGGRPGQRLGQRGLGRQRVARRVARAPARARA